MAKNIISDEIELVHFDNIYKSHNSQNPLLSNDSFDYDDMSSVVNTSHSGSNSNVFDSSRSKELNIRPKCNPIEPSKTYIGSASVVDSRNVLFGTIFNQPVVIRNLISERNDVRNNTNIQYNEESDPLRNRTAQSSDASYKRRVPYFGNKRRLIAFILASAVVLVVAVFVVRHYLHLTDNNVNKENIHNPSNENVTAKNISYGLNDGEYELIVRQQYGALPPKTAIEPLKLPIRRVIIAHTATPNCTDYSECVSRVRQMQNFHMNVRDWDDIGYNFLVGGDGRAYEGRGYRVGAHTKGFNEDSLCIAFIGDFTSYEAPRKQLKAAQQLISNDIKRNLIHPDYVLFGQRQIRNASSAIRNSPGIMLYNEIILWPHWSKDIIPLTL